MRTLLRRWVFVLTLGVVGPAQAQVRPADLSKLSPSAFRDDELDLPYYLAHFHRIANGVVLSGPRRGFIDIPVWRDLKDNQPDRKTVMFDDGGARVSIEHRGAFVEQLPLLVLPTDSLSSAPGQFTLRRGATEFLVRWTSAAAATVTRTDERVDDRRVVVVAIPGIASLSYDIRFK